MRSNTDKRRGPVWIAWVLVPVGLLLIGIPSAQMYLRHDAARLHPDPKQVPSVADSAGLTQAADVVDQARQIVRERVSQTKLPGVSVAVGSGGELVWAEGFGFADISRGIPVEPSHGFRIGTASVALTSAAVGLLVEEGPLSLDDEIQKYVPAFPKKQWPVTLRALMAHTAGIRSDGGDEGPLFGKQCKTPVEAIPEFADRTLRYEPGTEFRVSDYAWVLLSAAIEAVSGQPFLTFMQARIFEPLGMRSTHAKSDILEDEDAPAKNGPVTSYFPRFGADTIYGLHLMRPLNLSCYAGSSVFVSSPSDLVRFAMAVNNGKLLKPETVRLLQTSQRLPSGEETGYGLGWDLETATLAGKQTTVIGHDGELLGGMVASVLVFPEHDIVVSVAANISYADTYSLAVKIAEAFAGSKRPRT